MNQLSLPLANTTGRRQISSELNMQATVIHPCRHPALAAHPAIRPLLHLTVLLTLVLALAPLTPATADTAMPSAPSLLVEAEAFDDRGGWTVDTQFIELMGSPYLIAHGLGTPVGDATTTVTFPAPGSYRVLVRTKDWVAPWNAPGTPGRFQLVIDGEPLETEFGTQGAEWHWHEGGTIEVSDTEVTLALRDLTGFNGRCDAIFFTQAEDFTPPDGALEVRPFRRAMLGLPADPPQPEPYDLVVIGGGYAGTAAAISAARQGLRTALIQNRPVLGGNGSSEIRVWAQGGTRRGPYPHIGEIVDEFTDRAADSPGRAEEFVDDLKEEIVTAEPTLELFLNTHAFKVEMNDAGDHIVAVTAFDTRSNDEIRFTGRFFADCTGHGTIGALAGADYVMQLEGHLGMSNMWYFLQEESPQPFPETPWALPLEIGDFPMPRRSNQPYDDGRHYYKGEWFWESGFDKHPIDDLEQVRDWNLRAVFGAFAALKHGEQAAEYENAAMRWIAVIGGTRESRRLLGDVKLTGDEIIDAVEFPDGIVPTTWDIDLHYPREEYARKFPDNPFIARAVFRRHVDRSIGYPVPYRTFYSRNIDNLFMAGRNISVDRDALGSVRVMRTGGMMGEVVGKAAWVAVTNDTNPRGVYQSHLQTLLELCSHPGVARRDAPDGDLYIPASAVTPPRTRVAGEGVGIAIDTLEGIVVDNTSAVTRGNWTTGRGLDNYIGQHYLYHAAGGQGEVRFPFFVRQPGRHEVRLAYQNHENRATNVQVEVISEDGTSEHVINMQQPPAIDDAFHRLGTFNFIPGRKYEVIVTTEGADGFVHADAIQILAAE